MTANSRTFGTSSICGMGRHVIPRVLHRAIVMAATGLWDQIWRSLYNSTS